MARATKDFGQGHFKRVGLLLAVGVGDPKISWQPWEVMGSQGDETAVLQGGQSFLVGTVADKTEDFSPPSLIHLI